jgi:peptide deformylase
VRYHASDLFAEAIEHELDHLDGKLYFDLLDSIDQLQPLRADGQDEDEDGG